jgi:Ca2+/H+ antiporter
MQLLSFATEEIAIKVGQTLGGLMNATFGTPYSSSLTKATRWN